MGEAENNALQSGRRRTMIVAHGEEEEEDVAAVVAIKGEGRRSSLVRWTARHRSRLNSLCRWVCCRCREILAGFE